MFRNLRVGWYVDYTLDFIDDNSLWRKGGVPRPFCSLVLKTTRGSAPSDNINGQPADLQVAARASFKYGTYAEIAGEKARCKPKNPPKLGIRSQQAAQTISANY